MSDLGIALLGSGYMGQTYAECISKYNTRGKLVAISGGRRAPGLAANYGVDYVAEYADLHGILMAPHGTGNGLLGLAALVQVCATLPHNFIDFEYPTGDPAWWYDIVDGLPNPIVKNGLIEVWDRPGMGVEINPARARRYLTAEDAAFFD